MEAIGKVNCVAVTGPSGAGKSSIVHYAALQLQADRYEVIPCRMNGTQDIINFYNPTVKQVFVVDDWCGKRTINRTYVSDWLHCQKDLPRKLIKTHIRKQEEEVNNQSEDIQSCKLLISCRLNVFQDEQMLALRKIVNSEYNICSDELCLNKIEKSEIFEVYVGDTLNRYTNIETSYEYFPLLCQLIATENVKGIDDIIQFFKRPLQYIYKDLVSFHYKDVLENGNSKMCVLCLTVLFESFDIKWLDCIDKAIILNDEQKYRKTSIVCTLEIRIVMKIYLTV